MNFSIDIDKENDSDLFGWVLDHLNIRTPRDRAISMGKTRKDSDFAKTIVLVRRTLSFSFQNSVFVVLLVLVIMKTKEI